MLVIEDGSVVVDAESFITFADAKLKADNYGITFTDNESLGQIYLRGAYLWLVNLYESQLQGYRVSPNQTGIFPRDNVTARGFAVDADVIPNDIVLAQVFAASALAGGIDINAIKSSADLKSFSVDGVYSETYQDGTKTKVLPDMPQVYKMLKPYMAFNRGLTRDEFGV